MGGRFNFLIRWQQCVSHVNCCRQRGFYTFPTYPRASYGALAESIAPFMARVVFALIERSRARNTPKARKDFKKQLDKLVFLLYTSYVVPSVVEGIREKGSCTKQSV